MGDVYLNAFSVDALTKYVTCETRTYRFEKKVNNNNNDDDSNNYLNNKKYLKIKNAFCFDTSG